MIFSNKAKNFPIIFILTLSIFSTGCASKYGAQTTDVAYYPSCYSPVAELRRDEASVNDSTTSGAVVGALLGALIGGLSTGKAEGAVVGAAAGGAVGAVGGHAYSTSKVRERDKEFFREYAGQLDAETAQMSRANAAAKIAAKCYDKEFKKVIADAQAGKITKIELTNRYEEIKSGLQETSRILNVTYNNMQEKNTEYQKVMASETNIYDPVYAKHVPKQNNSDAAQRQTQVNKAVQSTKKWQSSKQELDTTKQDLDAQIQNNDRILEAALLG